MAKKVAFVFDPFKDTTVPRNKRKEARAEIADFVKEQVLSEVGASRSPVKGGKWRKALTPGYKAEKSKQSSVSTANLELSGDMLDDLDVIEKGSKLSLQIAGENAGKADGNNRGTYGKGSPIKGGKFAREFIPKDGQTFKAAIWRGINDIAKKFEQSIEAGSSSGGGASDSEETETPRRRAIRRREEEDEDGDEV